MKKYFNIGLLLCCMLVTSCGKKEVINETDFGVLESSIEETEEDYSIQTGNNIPGYEVRSEKEKEEIKEQEELIDSIEFYDMYADVDRSNFSEEEIEELEEIDSIMITDNSTGQVYNVEEVITVEHMRNEALTVWKDSYNSGEVSKEDIETYFNTVYERIPEEDRKKVLDDLFDDSITTEDYTIGNEDTINETYSDEELAEVVELLRNSGMSVNEEIPDIDWSNAKAGDSSGLPPLVAE